MLHVCDIYKIELSSGAGSTTNSNNTGSNAESSAPGTYTNAGTSTYIQTSSSASVASSATYIPVPTITLEERLAGMSTATLFISNNKDKTVEEILKGKRGSIKNAPKPEGSPGWDTIAKLTLGEVMRRAQQGETGFREFYKLLTSNRFNK